MVEKLPCFLRSAVSLQLANLFHLPLQLVHNLAYSHDGWVFDPSAIATLDGQKGLLDLTELVMSGSSSGGSAFREALQWGDVLPHLRNLGSLYRGRTVMLPLDANMMLLYYRKVRLQVAYSGCRLPGGVHSFC